MKGKWEYAAAVCLIVLLLSGCGAGLESGNMAKSASVSEAAGESAEETNGAEAAGESAEETNRAEAAVESAEETDGAEAAGGSEVETKEDAAEAVIRRIKDISISVREHPIDTDRYDSEADQIYKAAFLKTVMNQVPIYELDEEEPIYYQDLLQGSKGMNEAEFFNYVKQSDYFYQDFDGDGLPELTVNTEGPLVLKYDPEEDRTELYYSKGQGWNLLGTGQMYYESYTSGSSGTISKIREGYHYESVDEGEVSQRVVFYATMTSDSSSGWDSTTQYPRMNTRRQRWIERCGGNWQPGISRRRIRPLIRCPLPVCLVMMRVNQYPGTCWKIGNICL